MVSACAGSRLFQSTHPRRVRRPAFQVLILAGDVSIHAPTQGATTGACQGFNASIVSIHAPTQGATTSPNGRRRSTQRFNPRTHAGCDHRSAARCHCGRGVSIHARRVRLEGFPLLYAIEGVSIHAPTQGATISRSYSVLNLLFQSTHPRRVRHFLGVVPESLAQFQSTHPRRGDACWAAGRYACIGFQSTHPRRVRPARRGSHRSESSFNPRTHAGCDSAVRPVFRVGDVVSIHAPTQGATLRR